MKFGEGGANGSRQNGSRKKMSAGVFMRTCAGRVAASLAISLGVSGTFAAMAAENGNPSLCKRKKFHSVMLRDA